MLYADRFLLKNQDQFRDAAAMLDVKRMHMAKLTSSINSYDIHGQPSFTFLRTARDIIDMQLQDQMG